MARPMSREPFVVVRRRDVGLHTAKSPLVDPGRPDHLVADGRRLEQRHDFVRDGVKVYIRPKTESMRTW